MIEANKPVSYIDFGTLMKLIPMYILIRFAVVNMKVDFLFDLVYGTKCFSLKLESVNAGQASLGVFETLS